MIHTYRNKVLVILVGLLFLFALIAFYSYIQLKRNVALMDIGLSAYEENMIIIGLSLLSMLKVVYEIWKVEHPEAYERKLLDRIRRKKRS